MEELLKEELVQIAARHTSKNDVSHDILHAKRVLANAEYLGRAEHADLDILIPAALFHDLIVSPKTSPKAATDTNRSATLARRILTKINYDSRKIDSICYAISICSYSKNIQPKTLEATILQDADKLESTGVIAIMRTFASSGSTKLMLYEESDPLAESREARKGVGLDLFFTRLIKIKDRLHTKAARKIAVRRTRFLRRFLKEFKRELEEVK